MHPCGDDGLSSLLSAGFAPLRRALLLGLALAGCAAWAHVEPKDREVLPDFDRREERVAQSVAARGSAAANDSAAEVHLRTQVRGLVVDRDPLTGSAQFVGSPHTFLTGPGGQGGAVPAGRLKATPATDPHRAVAAFLDEYSRVFGHGAEVLTQTRASRDYVTAHNGLRTTVWQQQVGSIDVFGATLQAHVTDRGELVNVASRLLRDAPSAVPVANRGAAGPLSAAAWSAEAAVTVGAQSLGVALEVEGVHALGAPAGAERRQTFAAAGLSDVSARLVWLPMDGSTLALCWEVVATADQRGEMFRTLVAVETGEALVRHCLTNYLSNASYRVFTSDSPSPLSPGLATPASTQPPLVARTLVTTPALDTTASPNGWINDGIVETVGNNVDAHTDTNADNLADTPRPQASGAGRVFDPALDLTLSPATYRDAAVVDLFYWCNVIHDRLYVLGFTEAAGNFQTNNFSRGGLGNDAVQADAQDGSGTNNANFSTPPDGSPGRMQMFVFDYPTPDRDGDFDHEIVIHEYVHGLSNRLVGGGVGISALQTGGMGEGWSDFYSLALLSEPGDDPNANYASGGYATKDLGGLAENYYFGIRRYPYSTNLAKNPLTFRDIDPAQASAHTGIPRSPIIGSTANEVHNIGEVWCVTLWDARANLIAKHGAAAGNQLILQLVTDGMKLAPANPNFLQARDAILQADLVLTGGANAIELWTAFAKRGMGNGALSPASTTTGGLIESFSIPDDLGVTPWAPAALSGTTGGPFAPSSVAYTLSNTGPATVNWTAESNAAWLGLSGTAGALAPGGTVVVTATPNTVAQTLPVGTFSAALTFTNTTSGVAQSRAVSLEVLPFTTPIFIEDFESGALNAAYWAVSGTSTYRTQVTTANSPHGGARHLTMDSSVSGTNYVRNEATLTLDLTGRTGLQLWFWAKCFDDDPDGPPAAPFTGGANFDGVAISADGVNWYEVQPLRYPAIGNAWSKFAVDLDAAIAAHGLTYGANFKIRFNQYDNYDIPTDGIAIDDIMVARVFTNQLALTVPAGLGENAAPAAATVSATPAPAVDLTVALAAAPAGPLGLPATVTIPAGQTSVGFALTPVDDALLNGTRPVTLAATAAGWGAAAATVDVQDDESAVLGVNLPATATEGAGGVIGTVTVSAAPDAAVAVTLTSSLPAEVSPPATVVIPAGQTSANFTLTIIDDNRIDGTTNPTITASVANWTSGSASLAITDNESTALTLSVPVGVREGDSGLTATVSIGGTMTIGVPVTLTSDDTSELTVPAFATIPPGQTSVSFPLTVVDDTLADGAQTVNIGATALGFTATDVPLVVADNDAHHFRIAPVPNSRLRNQAFAVAITAEDVNNAPVTNFSQSVALAATAAGGASVAISPTTTGTAWTNGVWLGQVTATEFATGVVLTATAGAATGASNAFDVIAGPVSRFTWATVPSPQTVDTPFAAQVTALDAAGNTATSFNGTAALTLEAPQERTTGAGTAISAQPVNTAYHDSRTQTVYLASELGGAGRITALAIQVSSAPGQTLNAWTIRMKHTTMSAHASGADWENSGWTVVHRSNATVGTGWVEFPLTTPFDYDGTSNLLVDLSFDNSSSTTSGFAYAAVFGAYRSVYGSSNSQWGDPLTWSGTNSPSRIYSGNATLLRLKFARGQGAPVAPATTSAFVAGVWNGAVAAPTTGTGYVLTADDLAGHGGSTNAFNVVAYTPPAGTGLAVSLPASATEGAGPLPASVALAAPAAANLTVTLTSGSPAKVTVPASVTIPAGQTSAAFTLQVLDDTLLDGTKSVVIAATGGGLAGSAALSVQDNDSAALALVLPATATEGDAALTATLTLDAPASAPLVFNLASSVTGAALVPSTVTVATAARSASFAVTIVNDTAIDGPQATTISASRPGFTTATAPLTVNDNETTALALALPASGAEGTTGTGTVSISGTMQTPLTVALASAAPARVQVPGNVTILAGQVSASFTVTYVDNALADGPLSVGLTASAVGFTSATAPATVLDNDAHHFAFAPIASPQIRGADFGITVTALDAAGLPVTLFNAPVALTGSGGTTVAPASLAGWSNGVWTGSARVETFATGVVLAATDGAGRTGASNAFDVGTGPLSKFTWDPIASPQVADAPFNVTVRATDAGGNPAPGFAGTAALSALVPFVDAPTGPGSSTWYMPLYNSSYPSTRVQTIYPANRLAGAGTLTAVALRVGTAPGGTTDNWTIRLKHTTAGAVTAAQWDNTGWTTVHVSNPTLTAGWVTFNFTTPFDYDGTSNLMVDLSVRKPAVSGSTGYCYYTYDSSTYWSVWGYSSASTDPLTWPNDGTNTRSVSGNLLDLQFTRQSAVGMRPVATAAFASGVWTGPVSVGGAGASLKLRAAAVGGLRGDSTAFTVVESPNYGPQIFTETWESGTIGSAWTITGAGATPRAQLTAANVPHGGTRHLTMDSSTYPSPSRNEATLTLNLTGRQNVRLSFWAKTWGGTATAPSSPFVGGADFNGVAISADGTTWYEIQPLRSPTLPTGAVWTKFDVDLDAALAARGLSYGPTFKIRFNQHGNDYIAYNGLALDDLAVTGDMAADGWQVSLPATATEGAGALAGMVQLPAPRLADTTVSLSSTMPAKLQVPAALFIPSGQTSATFSATVLDDTVFDGPKVAYVVASGGGISDGFAAVAIADNDTAALTLAAPSTAVENSGTITGTLTLAVAPAGSTAVTLTSSDPTEATVPATATFAAGQTKLAFPITIVNDAEIDGPQTVTLTASVVGAAPATAPLTVTDNETTTLSLSLPYVTEGTPGTGTGTVSLTGTLPTPLVVTLTSANPAQVTVPATVTIPAGATSANFTATAIDDTLTDGTQYVSLTAQAAGFTTATSTISVYDNDLYSLSLWSVASPQLTDVNFTLSFNAYDFSGRLLTNFSGPVSFTAQAGGTPLGITPTTGVITNGSGSAACRISTPATGVTITVAAGGGTVTATTNAFEVAKSPTLALTPNSIGYTLPVGDSVANAFMLSNLGDRPLNWSVGSAAAFAAVEPGPEFAGTAWQPDAPKSTEAPTEGSIHAVARESAGAAPIADGGVTIPSLEDLRGRLETDNLSVRTLIPDRFAFTEGVTGSSISDGTSDMYDGGNMLRTNLAPTTALAYSDTAIATGAGGRYFTRKYDGLWVFAADITGVTYFETTGDLGADGSGATDTAVLTQTVGGVTYRGFVKRVYNAGDPSVNHLVIVADNGSVTHEAATSTNDDYHRITGLGGVTRIYYLLFARSSGGYVDNVAMGSIMTAFLNVVHGRSGSWFSLSPYSGIIAPGESTDVVVRLDTTGLTPGAQARTLTFTSNDPVSPTRTASVTLNVQPLATTLAAEPAVTGGTTNAVAWAAAGLATDYEAQAATEPTFSNPLTSGWVAASPYTFAGLAEGPWYFRVRPRRPAPLTTTWIQTSATDFAAGAFTDTTAVASSGVVELAEVAPDWTENFDAAGTDWSATIFAVVAAPAGSVLTRDVLSAAQNAPNTTPPLPVNVGGDKEGSFTSTGGTTYGFSARMPDVPANQLANCTVEAYIGFGGVYASGWSQGATLSLRQTNSGSSPGYSANLSRSGIGDCTVSLTRQASNGANTVLASGIGTTTFAGGCFRLRFSAAGSVLTASLWRASVIAGQVTETPVIFADGTNRVTAVDSMHAVGLVGLGATVGSTNQVYFDDVSVWRSGPPSRRLSGSLTSAPILPADWSRWGPVGVFADTSGAGTSLTLDVLDAAGAPLVTGVPLQTDLHNYAAVRSQPGIRLRANLATSTPARTPRLLAWMLGWNATVAAPAIGDWSPTVSSVQDATPPTLAVTSPLVVTSPAYVLTGTAADANGVSNVTLAGTSVNTADQYATWSRAVTLLPGDNALALEAGDTAVPGNVATLNPIVRFAPATGDSDGDGVTDLLEVATGSDPSSASSTFTPITSTAVNPADGGRYLEFSYRRLQVRGALQYRVEVSSDLVAWTSPAADLEELPAVPNADGRTETVTVRIKPSLDSGGYTRRFVRLAVTLP